MKKKPAHQSKTVVSNVAVAALAVGDHLAGTGVLAALGPWALPVWALANVALRAVTSQPIGSSR